MSCTEHTMKVYKHMIKWVKIYNIHSKVYKDELNSSNDYWIVKQIHMLVIKCYGN